jgi:hypothetical protein
MPKPPSKDEIVKVYEGLEKAGLGGYRIVSMHLAPAPNSAGAAAPDPSESCHAVQLPNGHWVIVCD